RAGIGWAPVEGADRFRHIQIRDVDDGKTAVPITDVEAITAANRMMAARRRTMPRCRFASGSPLPRHPPAHDLFRFFGIFHIQHHGDVAVVPFYGWRNVGVAVIEGEAVNALTGGLVEIDFARLGAIRDVEHFEPSL